MSPFNESDLIAYHLHELPAKQVRALLQAFQKDPALLAESTAIANMLAEYKHHTPFDVAPNVMERNWHAVRNALPRVPVAPPPFFRWRLPVLAGAGLALAVPIYVAVRHPHAPELKQEVTPSQIAQVARPTTPAIPVPPVTEQGLISENNGTTHVPGLFEHSYKRVAVASLPLHATVLAEPQHASAPANSHAEPVTSPYPLFPAAPAIPAPLPPTDSSSSQSANAAAPLQASASSQKVTATRSKHRHTSDTDLTLSMGGTFIGTRGTTTNGVTNSEGATNAVSAIGSFHQQFRPFVGYRVTASYTRPQFRYFRTTGTTTSGDQGIIGRTYELAGTYVVRGPHRGNINTYVEAGAGVMALLPPFSDPGNDYNISPAGIVGVSAEVPVSKHFGIHAAYRAQVFKGPDFHADPTIHPLANSNILISQEPSVGITYRFTQKQQQ